LDEGRWKSQRSEDGGQRPEGRDRKAEVRYQRAEIPGEIRCASSWRKFHRLKERITACGKGLRAKEKIRFEVGIKMQGS
jgi:hypothetical protein